VVSLANSCATSELIQIWTAVERISDGQQEIKTRAGFQRPTVAPALLGAPRSEAACSGFPFRTIIAWSPQPVLLHKRGSKRQAVEIGNARALMGLLRVQIWHPCSHQICCAPSAWARSQDKRGYEG